MFLFRRSVVAILLLCMGCAAQSNAPELNQRIERQVRTYFNIPADVQIEVGPRKPSPDIPSYDVVNVSFMQMERKGDGKVDVHKQTHDFLISKDNKSLVRMTKLDLTKDPYAELMSKIDLTGRPVRGNKNAKVTIVNFDDFECPFCSRMHAVLMQDILKNYGDSVRIVYKDFPIVEIHPWALHAANDANCLASQNGDAYWDYADYLHAHQAEISADMKPPLTAQFERLDKAALEAAQRHNLPLTPLQSCIKAQSDAQVKASVEEGKALGISATPMAYVNGEKMDGALPGPLVHLIVDRALRDAGQPVPLQANAAPVSK
ncbi:MAG: DsbA family protein [Terriglobales bacterium]